MAAKNLSDLESVGPETLKDFIVMGIHTVPQLAKCDAYDLYQKLCRLTETTHDPCVIDVFACSIAQARNPRLPRVQRKWWYWSRKRKMDAQKIR